jgi:hypothetical protein
MNKDIEVTNLRAEVVRLMVLLSETQIDARALEKERDEANAELNKAVTWLDRAASWRGKIDLKEGPLEAQLLEARKARESAQAHAEHVNSVAREYGRQLATARAEALEEAAQHLLNAMPLSSGCAEWAVMRIRALAQIKPEVCSTCRLSREGNDLCSNGFHVEPPLIKSEPVPLNKPEAKEGGLKQDTVREVVQAVHKKLSVKYAPKPSPTVTLPRATLDRLRLFLHHIGDERAVALRAELDAALAVKPPRDADWDLESGEVKP